MTEELDEINLVIRLKEKNSLAWKELYAKYSGKLTGACRRYVKGNDDLRDVLQNSFVKMFTQIQSFENRGKGALNAWMMRIVINEALQLIRKKGLEFDNFVEWETINVAEAEDFITELTQEEMIEFIQNLPDGYRTVFNLYVFEEKSHREIADLLEISEGTSASQLSRAKKILASQIKEYQQSKIDVS